MSDKLTGLMESMEQWTEQAAGSLDSPDTQAKVKEVLELAAKFWNYSWNNWYLIMMQKRNASLIKGYNGWLDMGRHVRKGEKAITILAPMLAKDKTSGDKKLIGFRGVSVFDVSQTDGAELPNLSTEKGNDLESLIPKLKGYCEAKGFPVKEVALGFGYGGYADGKETVVNAEHEANGRFCSMVHEIAHNLCHFKTKRKEDGKITKAQMEVEAELTSYLVAKHFNFEAPNAIAYLAAWKATGEALREALKVVARLAKEIILALEEKQAL
jgi:hypothetical protein